ncbi:MAG: hypothetical protein BWY84_00317 [Candidatus Aerophobetes bacterium ADurb.Bin490]|nr:MAG: hypothetical protein BWY84_00317 [Candidatus Aerophobetes bacterium ADurb.Bin490]
MCPEPTALIMSSAIISLLCIFSGFIHTLTSGSRYPPSEISETPLTVEKASLIWSLVYSIINFLSRFPVTESHIIGMSSGLLFVITGTSASSGSLLWARLTVLCRSCIAESIFRLRLNSTLTLDLPRDEDDVISTTSCTPSAASSIISVTSFSITSGAAPSQLVDMLNTGASTSGIWLTPRPR